MAVNKVATVVLIDRSRAMESFTSDGQTFFERSKWVLSRIILRKIFSYGNDEIAIVACGPEGIEIVSHLGLASWDMFVKAQQLTMSSETKAGNWGSGIVKAIDVIERETTLKRFKYKQLVILSNFSWSSSNVSSQFDTLIIVINGKGYKVLVVGIDIEWESQIVGKESAGLPMLLDFVGRLNNGVTLSFEEVEVDLKYYLNKLKAKRLFKIQMKIGSQITIPVRWMKASIDDIRLKFEVPHPELKRKVLDVPLMGKDKPINESAPLAQVPPEDSSLLGKSLEVQEDDTNAPPNELKTDDPPLENTSIQINYQQDDSRKTGFGASEVGTMMEVQEDDTNAPRKKLKTDGPPVENTSVQKINYQQDDSRKTRFGATEVLLTYADLEALQRKTGPASLTFLGTVKSSKITPAMMVASDIYLIVSDLTKKSQAQFSALVTALLKQNKYGLARRIGTLNGKVHLGILYPVSDTFGKGVYFLKVPFANWIRIVPFRPLPEASEEPLSKLMSQLIDRMSIDERGRDLLIKDPNFQLRCAQVERYVTEGKTDKPYPDHILDLFDLHPELLENGEKIIRQIRREYPIPPPPPPPARKRPPPRTKKPPTPPPPPASKSPPPPELTPLAEPAKVKELSEEEKKEIEAIEQLVGGDVDGILGDEDVTMC